MSFVNPLLSYRHSYKPLCARPR